MIQNARRRITGNGCKKPGMVGKGKCKTGAGDKDKPKIRDVRVQGWETYPLQTASLVSAATGNIRTYVTGRYEVFGVLLVFKAITSIP
jgi:hypothetical protein